MEDGFDMSRESAESQKAVEWQKLKEQHFNYTIDGGNTSAPLCANFGNLTAGMKYNFSVQALRSPMSPPESISQNYLFTTSKYEERRFVCYDPQSPIL